MTAVHISCSAGLASLALLCRFSSTHVYVTWHAVCCTRFALHMCNYFQKTGIEQEYTWSDPVVKQKTKKLSGKEEEVNPTARLWQCFNPIKLQFETDHCIKKMWYIYTMKYYSVTEKKIWVLKLNVIFFWLFTPIIFSFTKLCLRYFFNW